MNDRVIKTTIELAGEGSYKDKLNQIEKAMRNVNSQQKVVGAQFDQSDKSLAALTARMSVYQDRLTLQQAKLRAIKEEYERVVQLEGENSDTAHKLANEYNYASAQIIKTERAISGLQKEMGEAASKSRAWLKTTEEQRKALAELGKQAEQTAGKMSNALTATTTAAVTYSAKEYMSFSREMSNVATLADTTVVSTDKLSKQALAASNATGVAAQEIAKGAYTALSSGIDTANAMEYITEASKAAKAGQSDLNTVVDGSTSIMNAWKISSANATSVFEKLLVAQDKGKTTVGQISAQIGQITGLAPQLNMSLDETLAAVAALTKNGVQTSSAITGLRAVLSNVLKPTKEATEAAAALGLEFNAAALQSKGLTGFLADVQQKTGGSSEELAKLFGSVEGLSQVMLLGGSAAGDYADALEGMQNSAGKLDKAFATVTNNSAERLSMSLNKLRNNAIEFGQTLSPYIDMASGSLEKLSARISALSADEQKSLLQTALWTAGGLKAISMLSKMITTVKLLGAAAGPVGIAAVAITGLVAAIAAAKHALDEASVDAAWDRFTERANANVSGEMNAIITANVDTTSAQEEMTAAIKGVYDKVAQDLTDGKADTPEVVAQLKTDIASLFAEAKGNLSGLGEEAGEYAEELKTLEAETVAWIDGMAGKSTEYVNGHLGELDAIEARVQELIDKINEGNNSLRNENSEAYKLATAGATVNQETIAQGVSWAYTNRELDLQEIREKGAADQAAANQAYIDGMMSESEHLAAEKEIAARVDEEIAAAEQTYADRISALLHGVTEAFATMEPENAQAIADIVDAQGMIDILQAQIDGIKAGTIDTTTAQKEVQAIYDKVFGVGHTDILPGKSEWAAGTLKRLLDEEVNAALDSISVEDKGLVDTIMEILNSDARKALNIDMSNLQESLRAAYSPVGAAAVEGMAGALEDPDGRVANASANMANSSVEASKNTLDSHSPSRVFYGIGQDAIQGLINGAASKQSAVAAKFAAIARAAANAARKELQINSPSKVFETIGGYTADGLIYGIEKKIDAVERTMQGMVNPRGIRTATPEATARTAQGSRQTNVNVTYSGAFTRREAQRFGHELALQLAAENAGRGG